MNICGYLVGLCFGVVFLARATMAVNSIELHKLASKLESFEDKLQGVQQNLIATMESSLKKMEQRLQEKLDKLEKAAKDHMEKVDMHFETRMQAMEKSMEASNENTRTKLEALKNHVIPKMDHIQDTSDSELKKIGEYKNTLDMLTDSIRNISTVSEKSKNILEAHYSYPVHSCRQVMKISGRYVIHVGQNLQPSEVLCEQTKFEGGWMVIQYRYDGSVDFYRNWTEYRNGFGNSYGEFWLGLEYVHQITKNRPHELLVEMKDFHGNYGYAKYREFEIGNESEKYVLKNLGTHSGTAGDSMKYHKNQKFTTFDRDNDQFSGNCAEKWHGAWWYNVCYHSTLNGHYLNTMIHNGAMSWYQFKSDWRGLSYSRMMIREIIN